MVPEPMIFPFWFPPNLTSPADLSSRSWNIDLLPIMYREHPECRYHDMFSFVFRALKEICNRYNLFLRYPHSFGSFWVSSPYVLIELRFSIRFIIRFLGVCNILLGVCYVETLRV